MQKFALAILLICGLFLQTAHAQTSNPLFATTGLAGTVSTLVIMDPASGAVVSTIGSVGFPVVAMAFDPTSGALYGISIDFQRDPDSSLISIDPATGAGTLIGSLGRRMASIAIDASGAAFGWDARSQPAGTLNSNLRTINLLTGASAEVGDFSASNPDTRGQGLAFNSSGTLFWSGVTWDGSLLHTIDPATGLSTGTVALSPSFPRNGNPISSLVFDDDEVLFAVNGFPRNGSSQDLHRFDVSTGANTVIGRLPVVVTGLALESGFTADLTIEEADAKLAEEAAGDKFGVEGRFVAISPIDVLNEDVTVTFGKFSEKIPAGSFVRDDEGFRFKGAPGGIKRMEIGDDGEFEVKGKGFDLIGTNFAEPVTFSLRIGDDRGQAKIPFSGKFKFEANEDDDDDDDHKHKREKKKKGKKKKDDD